MNEQGGILSKILIIPVGIGFMAGFFFLGYYVGKYQSKTNQNEIVVPLPEVVSSNLPKREEFTFFKTLTDKEQKTLSIELKPKQAGEKTSSKQQGSQDTALDRTSPEKRDVTTEQPAASRPAVKGKETAKKEPVIAGSANSKIRYTLQFSSHQEKSMAEHDVRKLKQSGFAAFAVESQVPGKGTWYRVRIGSFSNRAAAEKLQKEVRAREGITPFISLE